MLYSSVCYVLVARKSLPEIHGSDVGSLRIIGSAIAAYRTATWVVAALSKHWANARAVAQQRAADPPNRAVNSSRSIITQHAGAVVHRRGVFCKDCRL
jgi:hypothetical protein